MESSDVSVEVAWLHYIGGLTQSEIAKRRGLSKATVHRLIRAAHEGGTVRVFVSSRPAEVMTLEQELIDKYGLSVCRLAPTLDDNGSQDAQAAAVASLAAQSFLVNLEAADGGIIGLGAGRTLAAMARAVPRINRPDAEFVSLTGEFSVFRVGQSPDVIQRLAELTGGTGYSIAAPFIANSEEDREVLIAQEGTRVALEKIREAGLTFSGIGHLDAGSFLTEFNLISSEEVDKLRVLGVVADFCGNLLDAEGRFVDSEIGRRTICCDIDMLKSKQNAAVAYGPEKVPAIHSVLKSGLLSELISDAGTAKDLVALK